MRVLIAFDWFWSYVAPQAEALARQGAEVALLCRTHADEFDGDYAERQRFVEQMAAAGIPVFEVPGRFRSTAALVTTARLQRQVRAWRPDVVHAHDNYDPRLLYIVRGVPLVLTVHDPTPHPGAATLYGIREQIRRKWIDHASCLVVHGESLRTRLAGLEPSARIEVLPHGAQMRAAPMAVPPNPTLLLFGRRESYKGLALLLDALEHVWKRRPEVRLVVAGRGSSPGPPSGDSRIELRDGYIPESELDELFERARLVVLPYIEASQSGVALQALGRGVPVVATDVGALAEVMPSRDFLALPADPRSLADRILQWLDHPASLRATVLDRTRERVGWDTVAQQAATLYTSVAGAGS